MMDGRLSARQLALKLGMSTVTILTRIKKMEKEKIILGYSALINHEKVGYSLTAIIEIIAKNDKIVSIEDEIAKFENVCGVYDITGSTDTIVIAKFKERDGLSRFVKDLAAIPNVENTITHVVLNTTKEDFRLS
jgi:DNA-binding Lrp family transcriptional regulator